MIQCSIFQKRGYAADNIINDDNPPLVVIDQANADGIPPDDSRSSLVLMILLPLVSVVILVALVSEILLFNRKCL